MAQTLVPPGCILQLVKIGYPVPKEGKRWVRINLILQKQKRFTKTNPSGEGKERLLHLYFYNQVLMTRHWRTILWSMDVPLKVTIWQQLLRYLLSYSMVNRIVMQGKFKKKKMQAEIESRCRCRCIYISIPGQVSFSQNQIYPSIWILLLQQPGGQGSSHSRKPATSQCRKTRFGSSPVRQSSAT